MKNIYLTVLLFTLMIAAIISNFLCVRGSVETLRELCLALPENRESAGPTVAQIEAAWDDIYTRLSLTVSYTQLDAVDDRIRSLRAGVAIGDSEYLSARAALLPAVNRLDRLERFSLDNLF